MNLARIVVGSQSKFFPEGVAFNIPAAGTCSKTAKPGIADTGFLDLGPIKWNKKNTSKTEVFLAPNPGGYVAEDEIPLSRGMTLSGKLEKQSNFAYQLALQTTALPVSPTAGGVYNPLSGPPAVRGWLHVQEYNQYDVLINTVDYWVSLKLAGDTNNDDKPAETPVEATVLFSTLNVGTLT
jgi:hypothetical protein